MFHLKAKMKLRNMETSGWFSCGELAASNQNLRSPIGVPHMVRKELIYLCYSTSLRGPSGGHCVGLSF